MKFKFLVWCDKKKLEEDLQYLSLIQVHVDLLPPIDVVENDPYNSDPYDTELMSDDALDKIKNNQQPYVERTTHIMTTAIASNIRKHIRLPRNLEKELRRNASLLAIGVGFGILLHILLQNYFPNMVVFVAIIQKHLAITYHKLKENIQPILEDKNSRPFLNHNRTFLRNHLHKLKVNKGTAIIAIILAGTTMGFCFINDILIKQKNVKKPLPRIKSVVEQFLDELVGHKD